MLKLQRLILCKYNQYVMPIMPLSALEIENETELRNNDMRGDEYANPNNMDKWGIWNTVNYRNKRRQSIFRTNTRKRTRRFTRQRNKYLGIPPMWI